MGNNKSRALSIVSATRASVVAVVALLCAVGISGVVSAHVSTSLFGTAERSLNGVASPAASLHREVAMVEDRMWDGLYDPIYGTDSHAREHIASHDSSIAGFLSALEDQPLGTTAGRQLASARQAVEVARSNYDRLLAADVRDQRLIADRMQAEVVSHLQTARSDLDRIERAARDQARQDLDTARRIQRFETGLVLAVLVTSVVLSLLLARRVRRWLVDPLQQLHERTDRVRHGDLTTQWPPSGVAELRAIAGSFNEMVAHIDRTERALRHQALHDGLTGLANRTLAIDRGAQALRRLQRQPGAVVAVMLDLDGFKKVNDTSGHQQGDLVLQEAARRLTACLRDTDTIARLGGDEFLLLVENPATDAETLAARVVEALDAPQHGVNGETFVSASVGVAVTTDPATDIEALIHDADIAMYEAKRAGGRCWQVFDTPLGDAQRERLILEADLARAVTNTEIVVHYQPTVRIDDGHVSGVEALMRWHHPTRGLLAPQAFLTIAEETGLIVEIGYHVLEQACRQIMQWRSDPHTVALHVNVSMRQLEQHDFVDRVIDVLERTGAPPHVLVLEITETATAKDRSDLHERLAALRRLGVRVALDDFGTGYSSLSYLRDFPVDILKIDKTFTDGLAGTSPSTSLVAAVVDLARSLDLTLIAEGVEHVEQVQSLLTLGCHEAQGYHFHRPMPADAVEPLLAVNHDHELTGHG